MRRAMWFLFLTVLLETSAISQCVEEPYTVLGWSLVWGWLRPEGGILLEKYSFTPPVRVKELGFTWSFYCYAVDTYCQDTEPGSEDARMTYDVVFFAPDGPGGKPGTLLAKVPATTDHITDDAFGAPYRLVGLEDSNILLTSSPVYAGVLSRDETLGAYSIAYIDTPSPSLGSYTGVFNDDDEIVWLFGDLPDNSRHRMCAVFEPALPEVGPPGATSGDECSGLDPNKPTVVLTHGLQDTDVDSLTELWTGFEPLQAGALIQGQLGPSVNICKWVWEGAFQEHFFEIPTAGAYIAANANTVNAARALSNRLLAELGENYSQPIHFIGHSLGVPVNAYATVFFLNGAPFEETVQFTALDRPHHISKIIGLGKADEALLGYGSRFLQETLVELARPVNLLKVDNFYSKGLLFEAGVGDVAHGPAYNHPELVDPGRLDNSLFENESLSNNDHTGVNQWYRWTIDPTLRSSDYPDIEPCVGGAFNPLFITDVGLDPSLSPCGVGWQWSLNADPLSFPQAPPLVLTPLINNPVDAGWFVEFGCTVNAESTPTRISCAEFPVATRSTQARPSAVMNLMLPPATSRIRFEYRFTGAGDGDYAVVSLDSHPIWSVPSVDTASEFISSGPISVGYISGAHFIGVALHEAGAPNTEFEIRSFEFISEGVLFADGFESGDTSAWQ